MRHRAAIWTVALLLTACSDGPGNPDDDPTPAGDGVTLVVAPGALLLAAGETRQLVAYAVDADGDSTAVAATFQSSAPGVVAVTGAGLVTGGATLGSAQIVARSGTLVSAPVLALRATPADGALLVSDAQVIGAIAPVDPTESGWRYRVRLRGVTPAVGQVVLASGGAPIGGRVVSVGTVGSDVEVVLELIPLGEMFAQLTFHESLSLEHADARIPDALRGSFRLDRRQGGAIRFEARERRARYAASAARESVGAARIEQEFDVGPFECKAEVPPAFVFPLTLDVFSFELDPDLSYDIAVTDGVFQRAVVTGSIAPRLTASPRITAAVEAKAECKTQIATLILPIGGPLAPVFGGQVPFGLGFEVGAKTTFGELGYDAFLQAAVTTQFGIDCAAGCQVVSSITTTSPGSYFKPVLPSLGTSVRFELGASGFGWADLAISALLFKVVEIKAGLEQKLELAGREAQAADAAYASSFSLKPVIEAKVSSNLAPIANILRINLATLSFAPELPTLAQSPRGTFTITPATVAPGNGTQAGGMATFTVLFTDVRYFGAYSVDGVEFRWRKTNGSTVSLQPGRPGCSDLTATDQQMLFTCQADFTAADTGTQTFHAFVKTRLFGVPIPLPLEVAADARATVLVGGGVTITPASATLAPGESRQFTATVTGIPGAAVTWSWTGASGVATSGNVATYTAGPAGGNFSITATSVQDPSKSSAATIQITSGSQPPLPPPPTGRVVRVIPDSVIVQATQINFFSATVTPSPANAVTWSAEGGSITQSGPSSGGLFRAGSVPGTFVVTARSVDDPAATGTAKVIVIANILGSYTGTACNTAESPPVCGPAEPLVVGGPLTLNGQIYVGFGSPGGGLNDCRSLARLVSTSGGATLLGTKASACGSGIVGDPNTEGAWSGTFSAGSGALDIVDGAGRYTYSLTKMP